MKEVCSLEEVAHWAKKGHLGSTPDPMEPGMVNLVVALGNNPWPHTLGLAQVLVALDQKLCSLTEAMNSAKEHFGREKGLETAHYYLTPVYAEAPYLLSDVGLQSEDGTATAIGAAVLGVSPGDNAVNLSTSEGATTNLVLQHLLHLSADLILIPLQLSVHTWTGMRRMKIGYESFIHFPPTHLPPNTSESECNSQQLTIMKDFWVPDPKVLLDLADQLDSLRTVSHQPEGGISRSGDKDDSKDETPKKRLVNVKDGSKKKRPHKSHEDKNWLRHSSADKSPASTSHEVSTSLDASRLGAAVVQACFSAA